MSSTSAGILAFALAGLVGVVVFLLLRSRPASNPEPEQEHNNLLNGLSGEKLWAAMGGSPVEGYSIEVIERLRQRYEFVLRSHIRELFEEGMFDARAGARATVSNTLQVSTLRGSVLSWIPPNHAETIYHVGFSCHSASNDELQALRESLDRAGTSLFRATGLNMDGRLSSELIPRFRSQSERNGDVPSAQNGTAGSVYVLRPPPAPEGAPEAQAAPQPERPVLPEAPRTEATPPAGDAHR